MGTHLKIPLDDVDRDYYEELIPSAKQHYTDMLKALIVLHASTEMPDKDYAVVSRVLQFLREYRP